MPVSEIYESYLAEFEELTGMKVQFEMLNDSDRKTAQLVDFKAYSAKYDVSNVGISNREEFVAGDYLEPLQPYLDNPELTDAAYYNMADYPKDVIAGGYSNDGVLVYIPYTAEYFLLWYREDIFDQLGLTVPKTITELEATAQAIEDARAAGTVDTYGFIERTTPNGGEAGWDMFCTANRLPVELMDFANMKALINTEGGLELMDYYSRMCVNYGPPGSGNWAWTDVNDAFSQGLVAMICGGNAGAPGCCRPRKFERGRQGKLRARSDERRRKRPLVGMGAWSINSASKKKRGRMAACPVDDITHSDAEDGAEIRLPGQGIGLFGSGLH